jgi:hypothetical protein
MLQMPCIYSAKALCLLRKSLVFILLMPYVY